jgi:hypothetical protein
VALAVLMAACASERAAVFPTTTPRALDERRVEGVAVDLAGAPPPARDRALGADGIVTLRTPLDVATGLDVVRAFMQAVLREDTAALGDLAAEGAMVADLRLGSRQLYPLANLWRERFRRRDYALLAAELAYRPSDVVTYRGASAPTLPAALRHLEPEWRPAPGDLLLLVPITTPTVQSERFFGDELYFWLTRQGERYLVHRMAEALPF